MGRNEFSKLLIALAQMCNFELNETILMIYDEGLKKNGYPKICLALKHILVKRKSKDPFPAISEIQELITPSQQTVDIAKEASARIIASISKFGYSNVLEAKKYIGELGWQVIAMSGGWSNVCAQVTLNNTAIYAAQFRELAATLAKKAELGLGDTPPALPAQKTPLMEAAKMLESKFSMDPIQEI